MNMHYLTFNTLALLFLAAISIFSTQVTAAMYWQEKITKPQVENKPKKEQAIMVHSGHGRGRGKQLNLHQGDDADVYLWLPTLVQRRVDTADAVGNYTVSGTGLNNYHLLMAERYQDNKTEIAMRYVYMHGKPSGESPALLINYPKTDLEIVPSPLPREHWRYYGDRNYYFTITYRGSPVIDKAITLTTTNGSKLTAKSDHQGMVSFTLPDDFRNVKLGRSNNKAADFMFEVDHQNNEHRYVTSYSAPYYVNPSHWQIQWEGFALMVVGFLGGLIFIDHKRREEEQS